MLLGDILAHGDRVRPGRTALITDGTTLTYSALARGTDLYRSALAGVGVRKGDRVAILTHNPPAYVELLFAVTGIGAVFVPLNFLLIARELSTILLDSEARFLLFDAEFAAVVDAIRPALPTDTKCLCVDRSLPGYPALAGSSAAGGTAAGGESPKDTDVALQIYTGGTSGRPRGAMLTHRNLMAASALTALELGLSREDIFLSCSPLPFMAGTGRLLRYLLVGGTIVFLREFTPEEALRAIEVNHVTHALFTPTMMARILDLPGSSRFDIVTLKKVVYSGSFIPVDLQQRAIRFFGCDLVQTYGQVESSGVLTFLPAEDHSLEESATAIRKLGSVGKEIVGIEVRVVDEKGRDILPHQVGEVIARGPNVFKGYFRDPGFTAEILKDGWLHTGDVASVDEEGYIHIVDRKRDMLMIGGIAVYPKEIENVIAEYPGVSEAAVVGRPDYTWGEIPVAIVALKSGEQGDADSLIAHCRKNMAPFKVPQGIDFVPSLPRNAQGKVLKAKLKDRLVGGGRYRS